MPGKVKLLNGAFGSGSGSPYKIGTAKPPYLIRIQIAGDPTTSSGTPITILTSSDGITYTNDFAEIGDSVAGQTETKFMTNLGNNTTCSLRHHVEFIKALYSGITGSPVTVFLEFGE